MQPTFRPLAKPALSPHRYGALRGSRCVSAVGRYQSGREDLSTLLSRAVLPARQAIFFGLLLFWASKRKVTRPPAGGRNARCVSGTLAERLGCRVRASTG